MQGAGASRALLSGRSVGSAAAAAAAAALHRLTPPGLHPAPPLAARKQAARRARAAAAVRARSWMRRQRSTWRILASCHLSPRRPLARSTTQSLRDRRAGASRRPGQPSAKHTRGGSGCATSIRAPAPCLPLAAPAPHRPALHPPPWPTCQQLADFLRAPMERAGGMMPLPDVFCLYNRCAAPPNEQPACGALLSASSSVSCLPAAAAPALASTPLGRPTACPC